MGTKFVKIFLCLGVLVGIRLGRFHLSMSSTFHGFFFIRTTVYPVTNLSTNLSLVPVKIMKKCIFLIAIWTPTWLPWPLIGCVILDSCRIAACQVTRIVGNNSLGKNIYFSNCTEVEGIFPGQEFGHN